MRYFFLEMHVSKLRQETVTIINHTGKKSRLKCLNLQIFFRVITLFCYYTFVYSLFNTAIKIQQRNYENCAKI